MAVVCIMFPDLIGGTKKVVFNPSVDQFELLQIKGFFNIYSQPSSNITNTTNFRVMVRFNGFTSRPIVRNHIQSLIDYSWLSKIT